MKKTQLLSVVFSLIMFTGITAGTAVAYAESDDDDYDLDDRLEHYCEMSDPEMKQLFYDYPELEEFETQLNEFCNLEEEEREDMIEQFISEHFPKQMEHEDEYEKEHDYDMKDFLEKYCDMTDDEKSAYIEEHEKAEDHQEKMEEYCSLDESGREAFIEEHEDEYEKEHDYRKHDYNMRDKMDQFCELNEEEKVKHIEEHDKTQEHLEQMNEYCSLDDEGRNAFIDEHKDSMKDKMSEHQDSMKSERKYHVLKASSLTDEQKNDIKAMHSALRDMKHTLRDQSVDDSEKQEIRNEFMEMAKEFSMTWLSPRHQVSAGIDAQMVECREGFKLIMKTSNSSPICVKETTAEKLIDRGIAISAF